MTDKIDDGGPAFPVTDENGPGASEGMHLRDYFAASALQGLLACEHKNHNDWYAEDDITGSYTRRAYEYADAMLAARSAK